MSEILDVGIAKGLLTTRGDVIVRSATAPIRLALGGKGKLLGSDGTDAVYVASVHSVNDFRLTLTSGTSVTTSDVTGATTMYLTPHVGNNIGLYDGTQWKVFQTAEISLALGTLTNALPYDVFAYDNAGTVTLEFTAWTNGTTRATALVRQDGVWCKTGALTRRYVGTFYTTATTTTEDSVEKRLLFNADNRVARRFVKYNGTSHTYNTNAWRYINNDSANRIEVLIGLTADVIHGTLGVQINHNTGSVNAYSGTNFADSATSAAASFPTIGSSYTGGVSVPFVGVFAGNFGVGWHFLPMQQNGAGAGGIWTWTEAMIEGVVFS